MLKHLRPLDLSDVPRWLRAVIVPAFIVFFGGLIGLGYCEHEQRFSSSQTPNALRPIATSYKGQVRFVSQTDATICRLSTWNTLAGGGVFGLLQFWALTYGLRKWRAERDS